MRGQIILIRKSSSPPSGSAGHRVAIIGSRKAGKTTLCASMHQCLISSAHGFSPDMTTRFPDAAGLARLERLFTEKFASDPILFRSESGPPVHNIRIGLDFSAARRRLFSTPSDQLSGYYDIEICDLRDDFDLFGNFAAQSQPEQSKDKPQDSLANALGQFEHSLRAANALIICHPAGERLAPSETSGFIRLMSDIAVGRYGEFDTIILALSKYERLFIEDGVHAFHNAIQPDRIIKAIADTINIDSNLEYGLRLLNSQSIDQGTAHGHTPQMPHLYAVPVSSFGFLKNNGAPNYDHQSKCPISALAPHPLKEESDKKLSAALAGPLVKQTSKRRLAGFTIPYCEGPNNQLAIDTAEPPHPGPHWLPFLAADPILTAISGIPSQFMLPLTEFLAKIEHDRELGNRQSA